MSPEEELLIYCNRGDIYAVMMHLRIEQDLIIPLNAFVFVCDNGHLRLAQWLIPVYKKQNNINNIDYNVAFRYACYNGHLKVAKWLYSLQDKPDIDISYDNDYIFGCVCQNGYIKIAKWLLEIKPDINISDDNDYSFTSACINNHFHIAKWLYSIGNINITSQDDIAFTDVCYNGYTKVAQWLQSLLPDRYELIVEKNKIVKYYVKREVPYNNELIILKYANKDDLICPICYDEEKCIEVQTNCNHQFCSSCIKNYYNNNSITKNNCCNCPYCRQPITSINKLLLIKED
jgi:hypothetical protein